MNNQNLKNNYLYLDWNVVQRVSNHDFDLTLVDLKQILDEKGLRAFFTDDHLMEISAIDTSDIQNKSKILSRDFQSLSVLTDNLYLERVKDSDDTRLFNAHPLEVYEQKGFAFDIFRKAFIEALEKVNFEKFWGEQPHPKLTANYLNNYPEEGIIQVIDQLLKEKEISQVFKNHGTEVESFEDLLIKLHHHINQANNNTLNLQSDYFSTAFFLLDGLGFKSEKRRNEKFYSSIFDMMHAFNAARTRYFVTDDEKLRFKVRVLYSWFGFGTIIMDIQEMITLLNSDLKTPKA